MPRQVKLPDGRVFTVPDDASMDEIIEVAERMDTGAPPEPSVMDERGFVDKAVDYLPSIGGTVAGFLGGSKAAPTGMALSGAGAAAGELARQGIRAVQGRGDEVPDSVGASLGRAAKAGALNAVTEGAGRKVIAGLKRFAPAAMRSALGAQTPVRKAFGDVDLDAVAVRERVIPGNAKSLAKIQKRGAQGAATLRNNLRVEDIRSGGAPVATHADAVARLRERVPDARMAAKGGSPEELSAVREGLRSMRGLKKRPLTAEEAFVAKQGHQKAASSAYRAKAGAEGDFGAEVRSDIGSGINAALKARVPQAATDLQRQQEMIALEQALANAAPRTPLLRNIMASATGVGTGGAVLGATGNPGAALASGIAVPLTVNAVSSPGALARYGIAADVMGNVMRSPGARVPDTAIRQQLLQLLLGSPGQQESKAGGS